jgi:hypothetical protein
MGAARERMQELARQGYQCSQILIILGLESRGEVNPDLVRAVNGLAGGCDEGSCTCGGLTSGCCLIALFAGKGAPEEKPNENYSAMMKELVRWFWNKYGFKYGGVDCLAITETNGVQAPIQRCWEIMEDVYHKAVNILVLNGIDLTCCNFYAA